MRDRFVNSHLISRSLEPYFPHGGRSDALFSAAEYHRGLLIIFVGVPVRLHFPHEISPSSSLVIASSLFCSEELNNAGGSGAGEEHTNPRVGGCVQWRIGAHGKAHVGNEEVHAVMSGQERVHIRERGGLEDPSLQLTEEQGTIYRLDRNREPPSHVFKVEGILEFESCARVCFQEKYAVEPMIFELGNQKE
jgi:hypothetical protein